MRLTKSTIVAATALATVTATSAFAQTTSRATNHGGPMMSATDSAVVSSRRTARSTGFSAYAAVPQDYTDGTTGVMSYDRYAGWDPDPTIRLMLKRDATGVDAP